MKARRAAAGLLLLAPKEAFAFWIVALIIVLIVVAGVVVFELWHCAKTHLWQNDHADINRVWVADHFPYLDYALAYTSDTNDWVFAGGSSNPMTEGFIISYGILSRPWIQVGALEAAIVEPISNIRVDDSGNTLGYSITATMNGEIVRCDFDSVTGWTSRVLESDTNLYPVSIERSVDLLNWSEVYSGEIKRLAVDQWTDYDGLDRAFYRIKIP